MPFSVLTQSSVLSPQHSDGPGAKMKTAKLSRRRFLRGSALAAGSIVTACDLTAPRPGENAEGIVETTSPRSPQSAVLSTPLPPTPGLRLEIAGGDREVWAWKRQVTGTIEGDCGEAYLSVGGRRIEPRRDDERFAADVPLDEGANDVVAICRHGD